MQAAGQWKLIEHDLGADWEEAHLLFSVEDPSASATLRPFSHRSAPAARAGSSGSRSGEKEAGRTRSATSSDGSTESGSGARSALVDSHAQAPVASRPGRVDGRGREPRRELGRRARRAAPRLARPPLRGRARLDGLPPARRAPRRAAEPDAQSGRDRPSLPGFCSGAGLRNLAGNGTTLPRADRGRRDHGRVKRA